MFCVVALLYLYFALTPWASAGTSHAAASVMAATVVAHAETALDQLEPAGSTGDLADAVKVKLTAEDDPDFPRTDLDFQTGFAGRLRTECHAPVQSIIAPVETRPPIA